MKLNASIIGFVLDEVLHKLQDFCWIDNTKEQVAMLTKFCDKFFEINASHCSKVRYPFLLHKNINYYYS